MRPNYLLLLLYFLSGLFFTSTPSFASDTPYRLSEAIGTPTWFSFGLNQRTRYEFLSNDFRSPALGNSQGLFLRNLLWVQIKGDQVGLMLEGQDSRAYFTQDTPLNTTHVNPIELLQAYIFYATTGLFTTGDRFEMKLGRYTLDLGSRRLVARNRFRNTINSFTGLVANWTGNTTQKFTLFVSLPVQRQPNTQNQLEDNVIKFDEERFNTIFWGLFYENGLAQTDMMLNAYALTLHEDDTSSINTRNRQLITPGVRVMQEPQTNKFDFEMEVAGQFGQSRSSAAATNTTNLDHRAFFAHLAGGFSFDHKINPRIALLYDYASGDKDPTDSSNERFDTLFGARAFEYGSTGIFGSFARSNVHGPGLKVFIKPIKNLKVNLGYRPFWLASKKDAWTTSGLQDVTGNSGSFVGHLLETNAQWQILPKNMSFHTGIAFLVPGEFMKNVPGGSSETSTYAFTSLDFAL
ncbi:MAG: alginate export family protein [Bdellovibrionota bacterium]